MEPITEFHIMCYHDIFEALVDIDKKIIIPYTAPKSITYVFDVPKTVNKVKNKDAIKFNVQAVYEDKLSKFDLPTNAFGAWSWEEVISNSNATVGTAGVQVHKAVYKPFCCQFFSTLFGIDAKNK